jgi:transcriptional regulator with XRE-family HTH domain
MSGVNSLSAIGARLKTAREAQNLTLKTLADAMGVTPSLLSQIENDKVQPSLNTLYQLATQLQLSIDDLLDLGDADGSPRRRQAGPVQRAADNPVVDLTSGVRLELLAGGAGGIAEPLMVTFAPHSSTTADRRLSRHQGYDFGVLIEGRLVLRLGFDEHELRAGDSVHFDTTRPHVYVNDADEPARGVWFALRTPAEGEGAERPGPGARKKPAPARHSGSLSDVLNALHNHDDWG